MTGKSRTTLSVIAILIVSIACSTSKTPATTRPTGTGTASPATTTMTPVVRVVAASILELRSGPGERFPNVGFIKIGQTVTVLEVRAASTDEWCSEWSRISYEPPEWICNEWLSEILTNE